MRLSAHDQGFVPAPPADVYAALADPAAYARWWPDVRSARERLVLLKVGRGRPMGVVTESHRQNVGLVLRLEGGRGLGTLEWYLEAFREGTIVNCILDLELLGGRRRAERRLRHIRASVRRGLVGLRRFLG